MSGLVLLILRILFAACLFAFLGLAIYTIWKDLSQQGKLVSTPQVLPLTLLQEGVPDLHPQRYTNPEIIIGRDPSCDYLIDDSTVSARHARLSFSQNHWWIEDLQSTNGTYLNQLPVDTDTVITNGDELRCGQVTFMISIGETTSDESLEEYLHAK